MANYQPTSRRPIAEAFRRTARFSVQLCLRWHVSADAISYSSILASALAALCFIAASRHPWLLLIAPLLCYVRLWLNMLDGMVALAAGTAGRRGEIINDLPDRISDVLIFAGVAHSGLCAVPSGYWAAIASVLTAYVGLTGQAVAGKREFAGIMSKPWRMVVLHAGAWATLLLMTFGPGNVDMLTITILDWTCMVILLGCIQTIVVRLRRIFARLSQDRSGNP